MKKIILVLILTVMLTLGVVGLTACNNATPQGQLANILQHQKHEVFEYDVLNTKDQSSGTYSVELDAYKANSNIENFGSVDLENVEQGILIRSRLTFGNAIYNTGVYFALVSGTNFMRPTNSYRVQTVDGNETFRLQGEYIGNSFSYVRTVNGEESKGTVAVKGSTVFDNSQFQQVLRAMTTFASGSSLSFGIPLVSENEIGAVSLTASINSVESVKTAYTEAVTEYKENGISCYRVTLSRSTEVAGVSQTLYYAVNDIDCKGWHVKNALVKIIEPFKDDSGNQYAMEYTLKTVDIS